ncbi:hypothetical protein [Ferruginibacter sp.]|nr:hypothetical protein [Ferruginibacter sp.]
MKTITLPKVVITLITIALFAVVLKSCKKVDKNAANTKEVAAKEAVLKAIQKEYGNVSAGIIIPVNKAADEYFYRDASGNMVSLYGNLTSRTGINGPSVCKANCNTTSNPADLRIIYTLDYVQRLYMCESSSIPDLAKSIVSVKWTVSVPFNFGYTIGNVPPLHYGNVVFKNSSGTPINTLTANNSEVTTTMIGADPSCPTWNNLWEVTYKFTQVSDGNFASGNTIEASVSLENDCALVGNVVASGYVSAPAFSQNAYLPCNRVDMVYAYSGITTVLGNTTAICTHPSGFTYTDYHQLEYRQVVAASGSLKWEDQIDIFGNPSSINWGIPLGGSTPSATFLPNDGVTLANITSGSGAWLVRYRNVKTGSCNEITPIGSIWPTPGLWVTKALYF